MRKFIVEFWFTSIVEAGIPGIAAPKVEHRIKAMSMYANNATHAEACCRARLSNARFHSRLAGVHYA